jgi:hypothetical protein
MVKKKALRSVTDSTYMVIQPTIKTGPRIEFEDLSEAIQEARGLLEGTKIYPNYQPPSKLLVVQVVGVVEASIRVSKLKSWRQLDREIDP